MKSPFQLLLGTALGATILYGSPALSKPLIQISTDPSVSRKGEAILFKIAVQNDDSSNIESPEPPAQMDWDILNAYSNRGISATIQNGKVQSRSKAEFSYILKPRKKGLLRIPSFVFRMGGNIYKTVETTVEVQSVAGGGQNLQQPPARPPPSGRLNPGIGQLPQIPGFPQIPDDTLFGNDIEVPERETFFLRAEPSKTNVYVGEMIQLPYYLYQRGPVQFAEQSINKFPDFKGFLKEELNIPRNYFFSPVQIKGQSMMRAEIFRFALFPLNTGMLTIGQMNFSATVMPSQADILNSIMRGQIPQNMGSGIPMQKASNSLKIVSKPLPPAPSDARFTGGVGQFQMDIEGPQGDLSVDQPFTVKLKIVGTGNIKSIEEPPLEVPPSLEPFQTKNEYEFKPAGNGSKTFEYLLLPRKEGKFTLSPVKWTYFDPATEKYVSLTSSALNLNILPAKGGAPSGSDSAKEAPVVPKAFSPWRSGPQNFVPLVSGVPERPLERTLWVLLGLLYAALIAAYSWKARQDSEQAHFAKLPWEKTAILIRQYSSKDGVGLAILVDQWTRERLVGSINGKRNDASSSEILSNEASREEILSALRSQLHPERHKALQGLQDLWSELDLIRFASDKRFPPQANKKLFAKAQSLVEPIVKSAQATL